MIEGQRLARFELLADLGPQDLERLCAFAQEQVLEPGALLVREGEFATDLFLIEDGVAHVIRAGQRIGEAGAGAVVGEIGVVGKQQRTADVVAATRMCVIRVSHWEIKHLPAEVRERLRTLAQRRLEADGRLSRGADADAVR